MNNISRMDDLSHQIDLLRYAIRTHYQRLEQEAVWFFIATIGCWSIAVLWIQVLAMLLVFFFFVVQVFKGYIPKDSFGQQVGNLYRSIESSNLSEDNKNQLVGQLTRMNMEYLPFKKMLRLNYKFVVAATFFVVSLMALL